MYSSICMVYMPIFIYSSCPALLRVELRKKKNEELFFVFLIFFCCFGNVHVLFLFSVCLFVFVFYGSPSQIDEEKRNMTQSKSFPLLCLWC